MDSRKKITIMSPCYNEERSLDKLYQEVKDLMNSDLIASRYDWELLLVNDGSRDNSLEKMRELRNADDHVCFVNLSRNFGKENAMLAGFDYATGDCVIVMDADLQHPVSVIPEMIGFWEDGYDDVYGKRRVRGTETWLRKKLCLTFYSLLQKTTRIEILQNVGDFRLLDRRCVESLRALRETQRYTKGLYCWIGYKKKELLYDQADRQEGKSSFNYIGLLNLAIDGITGFTTSPLRISSVMGFIVSLAAFVYLVITLTKTILYGEPVQGYPTLICVILFLGGCQLIAIGIIGEYVGRIFNETKNRPVYIIDSYNDEKKL